MWVESNGEERSRLLSFRLLARAFVAGQRTGERGNLGEMLFGEVFYNGLLSTPEVEASAWEFAAAAREEGK